MSYTVEVDWAMSGTADVEIPDEAVDAAVADGVSPFDGDAVFQHFRRTRPRALRPDELVEGPGTREHPEIQAWFVDGEAPEKYWNGE